MTPIQQDPARRIRRIQRLKMKPGERFTESLGCPVCDIRAPKKPIIERCKAILRSSRLATVATLANKELDWLCRYAADVRNALHREESNKAAIALDLERENEVLGDIKAWSSEEINELRSKLDNSEKARKSAEFYMSIHSADSRRAHTELLDARRTIAEQKARIEAVNALLSEHGCYCECDCAPGEHEVPCAEHANEDECNDDCPVGCDVCFACRVQAALCG